MLRVQKNRARLSKLGDEDDDFVDASPAGRVGMIWELTAGLWSLQGQDCAQQRLQKHVGKLIDSKQPSKRPEADGLENRKL